MLFPLQRDCDEATMTLTMTVTIQARDQDVPSKVDLPRTGDRRHPSENKLAVQQSFRGFHQEQNWRQTAKADEHKAERHSSLLRLQEQLQPHQLRFNINAESRIPVPLSLVGRTYTNVAL